MKASRLLIAGAVAALLPIASVLAQSPTPDQPDQAPPPAQSSKHVSTFDSLDTDKDGRISKSEAAADENVSAQFSKYDLNGDGYIERDEVTKANHPQSDTPNQ
jgi:hypothetical protein